MTTTDTIVALATPPGKGGVGIVRVSGPAVNQIAQTILGTLPNHRVAKYLKFKDSKDEVIDQGLAIRFEAPNSFTGEDVLEFHGHGGPIVLDILIREILNVGGRVAHPGEFSERAFLNDKIDLLQAEAIADLIESNSEQAARKAVQSLQGFFSSEIKTLVDALISLRIFVEASIDFPEEEIDFLSDTRISTQLEDIKSNLNRVFQQAQQGAILREGLHVVIVGVPNAGKSSLLNVLSGRESAIVTNIPGTTRDVLREQIIIDGITIHVTDTAGLRESNDEVERIGIERAKQEISRADLILFVVDSSVSEQNNINAELETLWPKFIEMPSVPVTILKNKSDLSQQPIGETIENNQTVINISAKHDHGLDMVRNHLKKVAGFDQSSEGGFLARRRHLQALESAQEHLNIAGKQLIVKAGELLAEELRITQQSLSEITGEFTSDDLLGRIFSSFCIGK